MEKLKLTEKQKFVLLYDSTSNIVSQGKYPWHFVHPCEVDSIKFNAGNFTRKNGARIEILYVYEGCTVRLLYIYSPICELGVVLDYKFIPKAITIDRPFKNSILISILPDPENSRIYRYQSLKTIQELCEGDSVGADAGAEPAGACLVAEDVKTPAL